MTRWTDKEVNSLYQFQRAGLHHKEISTKMSRSYGSVYSKWRRMSEEAGIQEVTVKAYIDKYEIQGEDVKIIVTADYTKEKWELDKQKVIGDFVDKFSTHFEKKFGAKFDDFGMGRYADNRMNRSKNRVGLPYDKGAGLRDKLSGILMNRTMSIQGESNVLGMAKKKKR